MFALIMNSGANSSARPAVARLLAMLSGLLLLGACAVKPPVQEMAEARSAIESARQLEDRSPKADKVLKSAEQSLQEAADAIDEKSYEAARHKAIEAKRQAQLAAKINRDKAD
jgi:hypothetical protein